jgi:hypothetical protein
LRREEAVLEGTHGVSVLAVLVVGALYAKVLASQGIGTRRALLKGYLVLKRALEALWTGVLAGGVSLGREGAGVAFVQYCHVVAGETGRTGPTSELSFCRVEALWTLDDTSGLSRVAAESRLTDRTLMIEVVGELSPRAVF